MPSFLFGVEKKPSSYLIGLLLGIAEVKSADTEVPSQTLAALGVLVKVPATGVSSTVTFTTLDGVASDQSALQFTRDNRLNHVVCVKAPGWEPAELLLATSENPDTASVVEATHLNSSGIT